VASPQTVSAHKGLLEGAVGAEYVLQSPDKASNVLNEYKASMALIALTNSLYWRI